MSQRVQREVLAGAGLSLAVLVISTAQAGTGLRSEENLQYRGTLSLTTATKAWDRDGNLQDIGCRSMNPRLGNNLEYGYSYYYTLLGSISLGQARCGDNSVEGLGDLELGVRGRIDQFTNDFSWELTSTIPTSGRRSGQSRLDCGVFGLKAEISQRNSVSKWLSLGSGLTFRFWESPLAHQFSADLSGSGRLGSSRSPWSWYAGVVSTRPLSDAESDPLGAVSDCGTENQVLRGALQLRYVTSPVSAVSCGVGAALAGEDVSRSRGLYCAYSYLWN